MVWYVLNIMLILLQINTFQCVLATSEQYSVIIFLYAYEGIQWTTGYWQGGNNGLGGNEAVAGINGGDYVNYFTIPGSRTPNILNIAETSNVGNPGVWMFQFERGIHIAANNMN